jgi:hypothetical protein
MRAAALWACYTGTVEVKKRAAVPSHNEIRAAATVLTDDRIAELRRGLVSRELVIKLILEAAEQVRTEEHSNPMVNRRG